jgi:dienelactone hydrolase
MYKVMKTSYITYNENEHPLEGYAAFTQHPNRPLVMLCHAWNGRDDFICREADLYASWDYNCFALDVYGKHVLGKTKQECTALKQPLIADRQLLKKRLMQGFKTATSLQGIDKNHLAVVGFGFGGLCALDLARFGLNIKGAVSVYGHYDPFPENKPEPITAKFLLIQGYDDPIVPIKNLESFNAEMQARKGTWNVHLYSHTLHSFMNPQVNDPESGLLYNKTSAQQARNDIRSFLSQIF